MAKIAIITGAAGGIGSVFTDRLSSMEDIDEIWAVGRNPDKLEALRSVYTKVVPVVTDLSDGKSDLWKPSTKCLWNISFRSAISTAPRLR